MSLTRFGLRAALALGALLLAAAAPATAQGRSSHGKAQSVAPAGHKKGKAKRVSTQDAFVATRDVLEAHGYEVVRYEERGDTRIVYYRRGNRGRGRGQGPLEKMVIRHVDERVVFDDAPDDRVLLDIRVRLDL